MTNWSPYFINIGEKLYIKIAKDVSGCTFHLHQINPAKTVEMGIDKNSNLGVPLNT